MLSFITIKRLETLKPAYGTVSNRLTGDIDIHAAEFGWEIDQQFHTGKGGLHPEWNKAWQAWIKAEQDAGRAITKGSILRQIENMKADPRFKDLLAKGKQATRRWNSWRGNGRCGLITGSALAALGATTLIFAGVEYEYSEYLGTAEPALKKATGLVMGHTIQALVTAGEVPADTFSFIKDGEKYVVTYEFTNNDVGTCYIVIRKFGASSMETILPPGQVPAPFVPTINLLPGVILKPVRK